MWQKREYQQCVRCIMDTSDPEIRFDSEGHCNHCTAYLAKIKDITYQGEKSDKELEEAVERVKEAGKNSEYDCVMGISGGVDSCYMAYIAQRMGLRILAVHMDNGWNSEEAVKNIKTVCTKLGIDYQSYVLDWEEFKQIQLAFLRASIIEMEIPTDVAIPGALHRVAAEHNVKYVISGSNLATEGVMPRCWFYYPKDSKLVRSICKQFGPKKIKSFPFFDYPHEMYFKFVKGIRMLYPLNYVSYDKEEVKQFLIDELGWIDYGGKHHESKYTKIVLNYIQPVKFGVDYRRAVCSSQICMGVKTREEALEEMKTLPYNPDIIEQEKEYVARKFGITLQEFNEILDSPPKSYRDYPNNEKLLKFIYGSYRKVFNQTRSVAFASYES